MRPATSFIFAAAILAACSSKDTTAPQPAGPAAGLVMLSGNLQVDVAGHTLAKPLTVRIVDSTGRAVPNATVYYFVVQGSGTLQSDHATSGASGTASDSWTLGSEVGEQDVIAEIFDPSTGTGIAAVIFKATATARPRDGTSVTLDSRPYALAISHDVVYVGQLDAGRVARFNGTSTTPAASIAVGNTPTELAFNAAGTKAYVTNQYSSNVGIIDVASNTQTATIPVSGNPFAVIVSPDGGTLYVTTNTNYVYKISLASNTVTDSTATGQTANGLAFNADGSKLYVSTRAGGSVIEVQTSNMAVLRTFPAGGLTQQVLVGPGGTELYVASEDGNLYIFNLASGNLAGTVSNLGDGPWGMALSPDGTKLWISVLRTGDIKVVDRTARTVSRTLYVGGTPRRIGFLSNGTAVVANEGGYVTWLQ